MRSFLVVVFCSFIFISCNKIKGEIGEKVITKGGKAIAKSSFISPKKSIAAIFDNNVSERLIKEFDDDVLNRLVKNIELNPALIGLVQKSSSTVKVLEMLGTSPISKNINVITYFSSSMDEIGEVAFKNKYIFNNIDNRLIVKNPNGEILGEISESGILAKAGKGGKELNVFINERQLIPNLPYNINGHIYLQNELGQVVSVKGVIRSPLPSNVPIRNVQQQGLSKKYMDGKVVTESGETVLVKAGYPKYLDDGGHLLANRFGGGSEMYNYIPMHKKLNQNGGGWAQMENLWAKAINDGKKVNYKIEPIYKTNTRRPDQISVTYEIDGKRMTQLFDNN